jgi:hypothetical protein
MRTPAYERVTSISVQAAVDLDQDHARDRPRLPLRLQHVAQALAVDLRLQEPGHLGIRGDDPPHGFQLAM